MTESYSESYSDTQSYSATQSYSDPYGGSSPGGYSGPSFDGYQDPETNPDGFDVRERRPADGIPELVGISAPMPAPHAPAAALGVPYSASEPGRYLDHRPDGYPELDDSTYAGARGGEAQLEHAEAQTRTQYRVGQDHGLFDWNSELSSGSDS
jgi:hypothetical protein